MKRGRPRKYIETPVFYNWTTGAIGEPMQTIVNTICELVESVNSLTKWKDHHEEDHKKVVRAHCNHAIRVSTKLQRLEMEKEIDWEKVAEEINDEYYLNYLGIGIRDAAVDIFKQHGLIKKGNE